MSEANKSIKSLVGRKMTKAVPFCDSEVEIFKLSVAQVQEIQATANANNEDDSVDNSLAVLKAIVKAAVNGGTELSDEDFTGFPMDELKRLSDEIMKFSGISKDDEDSGKSD